MKVQALLFLSALVLLPSCKDDDEEALTSYITCPDDHHPHLIDLGLLGEKQSRRPNMVPRITNIALGKTRMATESTI